MIKTISNIPKIRSYVIGCGMTKFEKPGNRHYLDMTQEAVTKALWDARIDYRRVKNAIASFCYGESCSAHRALYEMGMTNIPIQNVSNNCSTGGTALILAKLLIETGKSDCVLALGFEESESESLELWNDRTVPFDKHFEQMLISEGISASASELFGNAGEEHMRKYGSKPEHFAKIAYKNHKHSVNNPYSQFQDEYTLEQIKTSPQVHRVLTKLQCCPTSDGSACCIVASEDFVRKHKLESQAVEIVAMEMNTDFESTFNEKSSIKLVGYDLTKVAAQKVFAQTNYKPQDVDVVELHDCFSANELITYEALGLCPEGKAHEMIDRNDNTYGGKYVINPSGGLISKGHPLGATGLAQCSELCWQLRGEADKRQVQNCKLALQHNLGLGGAVVIALYRLGFPDAPKRNNQSETERSSKIGTIASKNKVKPTPDGFLISPLMKQIERALEENKNNIVEKVSGIYGFRVINGPGGTEGYWVINAKTGKGKVTYNGTEKPDLTYTFDDKTMTAILKGELNPLIPFFEGKVKVSGSIAMAFKLVFLQKTLYEALNEIRNR